MQSCDHAPDCQKDAIICTDQIHYPSEDYPCLCEGVVPPVGTVCEACGHPSAKHLVTRHCTVCGSFVAA